MALRACRETDGGGGWRRVGAFEREILKAADERLGKGAVVGVISVGKKQHVRMGLGLSLSGVVNAEELFLMEA